MVSGDLPGEPAESKGEQGHPAAERDNADLDAQSRAFAAAPDCDWPEQLAVLIEMGFASAAADMALSAASGGLEDAIGLLACPDTQLSEVDVRSEQSMGKPAEWEPAWDALVAELQDYGFRRPRQEFVEVVLRHRGHYKTIMKELVTGETCLAG